MSTSKDSDQDDESEYPVEPVFALIGVFAVVVLSFLGAAVYMSEDVGVGDTPITDGYEYPNGTNAETIDNTTRLILSHQEALSSTSYQLSSTSESLRGSTTTTTDVTYEYDDSKATFSEKRTAGAPLNQETERQIHLDYQNQAGYQQTVSDGNTTYARRPVQSEQPYVAARSITAQVSSLDWTFVNMTTQQGVQTALYEVDGVAEDSTLNPNNFTATGQVYVSERGIVRQFEVSVASTAQQQQAVSSSQTITVDRVGETSVQSPEWIETAIENTQETNTTG